MAGTTQLTLSTSAFRSQLGKSRWADAFWPLSCDPGEQNDRFPSGPSPKLQSGGQEGGEKDAAAAATRRGKMDNEMLGDQSDTPRARPRALKNSYPPVPTTPSRSCLKVENGEIIQVERYRRGRCSTQSSLILGCYFKNFILSCRLQFREGLATPHVRPPPPLSLCLVPYQTMFLGRRTTK